MSSVDSDDEKSDATLDDSDYEYEYVDEDLREGILRAGTKRAASASPPANLKSTGLDDYSSDSNRHSNGEELGFGSVCTRCQQEKHAPVRDCNLVRNWIQRRQQLWTVDHQYVTACCKKYIRDCAERFFDISVVQAGILCRQDGWDLNRISLTLENRGRNFVADIPRQQRNENADSTKATTENLSCLICFDDGLTKDEMMSMDCDHAFCLSCWRSLIETMLNEGLEAALQTTCPIQNCEQTVTEVQIKQVAPDLLPVFENRQLQSFIQANPETLRWCPGPDCDCIAVHPSTNLFEDNVNDFRCDKCHTHFCFRCGEEPHNGECQPTLVGANAAAALLLVANIAPQLRQLSSSSGRNDTRPIKLCPGCTVMIEKTGGCNHMTCKCGLNFCWICLAVFDGDEGHFCGWEGNVRAQSTWQPQFVRVDVDLDFLTRTLEEGIDVPDATAMLQQLKELERYAHYYNRFVAHGQGQRFAESQCRCLESRAENYSQFAGFQTGGEVDFIQSANETLVASRRLLKYTYCSAYHEQIDVNDSKTVHLGFHQLERLERFTEQLSEVSENVLSRRDRARVIDLVSKYVLPLLPAKLSVIFLASPFSLLHSYDP